jgi:anti-sigma factor (TIGR02949 family)
VTDAVREHARVRERMAAFADGELPLDEARSLREHLRTCAQCRRELALQHSVSRALAREPIGEASPDLRRRIEQVAASVGRRARPIRRRRPQS